LTIGICSKETIRSHVRLKRLANWTEGHLAVAGPSNLGVSILTAWGLVFIGSSMDDAFGAFDVETEVLWTGRAVGSDFGGSARKLGTSLGDSVAAFALA
jgi:hypothetical protein